MRKLFMKLTSRLPDLYSEDIICAPVYDTDHAILWYKQLSVINLVIGEEPVNVSPQHRRQGLAEAAPSGIIDALKNSGVKLVEAFPRSGNNLDVRDLWTLPEILSVDAGIEVIRDDPAKPVLELTIKIFFTDDLNANKIFRRNPLLLLNGHN